MTDRLQEIRARLDAMPSDRPWHVIEVSALIPHVRADIAWLLDQIAWMEPEREKIIQWLADHEGKMVRADDVLLMFGLVTGIHAW